MRPTLTGAVAMAIIGAMAIVGAAGAQDRSDWPEGLSIGTAGEGSPYFAYGSGLAKLVSNALGITARAEATGGPVQNLALIQTGDLELAMVTTGSALEAWSGGSALVPGLQHDRLRTMFPMYRTPFQIVALASSGIDSAADLDGKKVGLGPAGGTSDTYFRRFFETLGIDVQSYNGGENDLAGQLRSGLIDALAFAAGIPVPAFIGLEEEVEVNIFSFDEKELAALLEAHPATVSFSVPADTYASVDEDQETVAIWNLAVVDADMPEDLVYGIVKAVMESDDRMVEIHGSSSGGKPKNVSGNGFLPFHPGAVRWFEENGYDIPPELEG